MAAEMIDHATLTELARAGAVRDAHVVGQPGGWFLRVRAGAAEHTLAAQRSRQVRIFRRMETLVSYLKDVGIEQFAVDAAAYEIDGGVRPSRPDRAQALRRVHEAAAHDAWFRAEIGAALAQADDPTTEWIAHETVREDMERQRAALLARISGNAG